MKPAGRANLKNERITSFFMGFLCKGRQALVPRNAAVRRHGTNWRFPRLEQNPSAGENGGLPAVGHKIPPQRSKNYF